MPNEKDNNDFIYDIAFSYASEQGEYVHEVYQILKNEYNVNVFYDQDIEIQADLWGKDLGEELQRVYEEQSRWCLLFISKEYKEKFWTRHEKRSALSRAIKQKGIYLLTARFDDTEIEGIPSTTCFINISAIKPENFSKLILRRLGIPLKQKDTLTDFKVQTDISKQQIQVNRMPKYESKFHVEQRQAKEREFIKRSIEEEMKKNLRRIL